MNKNQEINDKMTLFTLTDTDRQVYEKELRGFLPEEIIDIHTHVWLSKYRPEKPLDRDEVKRAVTWPSLVAKDNSVEDLIETYQLMFPGKNVTPLIFTNAKKDDLPACNAYIHKCMVKPDSPGYTTHTRSRALKNSAALFSRAAILAQRAI
jgi:hypothetical protein